MTLVTFFYKDTPRGNIGGLSIDVTTNDGFSLTADITDYPVEEGSFISDHITLKPYTVPLRGVITDSPLYVSDTHENAGYKDSKNSRVKNAYEKLLDLYYDQKPFTVVTGLDIFEDVFFTSLDVNRDPQTGQALSFDAKFKNILFATPKIVPIPREKVITKKKDFAQSDVNKGAEQTSDAETKHESVSILYKLFGNRYSGGGVAA